MENNGIAGDRSVERLNYAEVLVDFGCNVVKVKERIKPDLVASRAYE